MIGLIKYQKNTLKLYTILKSINEYIIQNIKINIIVNDDFWLVSQSAIYITVYLKDNNEDKKLPLLDNLFIKIIKYFNRVVLKIGRVRVLP